MYGVPSHPGATNNGPSSGRPARTFPQHTHLALHSLPLAPTKTLSLSRTTIPPPPPPAPLPRSHNCCFHRPARTLPHRRGARTATTYQRRESAPSTVAPTQLTQALFPSATTSVSAVDPTTRFEKFRLNTHFHRSGILQLLCRLFPMPTVNCSI